MSSEEDYESSSSSSDDDGNDGSDFEEPESAGGGGRNARSRGGGDDASSDTKKSSRGSDDRQRRYTASDIDREIAARDEDGSSDGDGGGSGSGGGSSSDDGDGDVEEDWEGEEEVEPRLKQRAGRGGKAAAKRGAIKSTVRKTGTKQRTTEKKKHASSKGGKNKTAPADSESEEEEDAYSEESPDEDDGGEWDGDDTDDTDDDDDDFAAPPRKRGGTKKKTGAKARGKVKKRYGGDDSGGDDDDDDDDDSSSDFGAPPRKRGGAKRKTAASKAGGKAKKRRLPPSDADSSDGDDYDDADDDDDDDDDSDSDFGAPRRKRGGAKKKARKRKLPASDDDDDDHDDDEDDSDSDFGAPRRRKGGPKKKPGGRTKGKKAPARSARRAAPREPSSDDEEKEEEEEQIQYETTPGGTRRPRRQCKSRTQQKMHDTVLSDMKSEREALAGVLEEDDRELLENSDRGGEDEDDGSSGNEEEGSARSEGIEPRRAASSTPKKKKKRGNKYDEDESYDEGGSPGDAEDDSGEDDESDYEESDDGVARQSVRESARTKTAGTAASYRDVDESDVGTADEDSADEADGPSVLVSPAVKGSKGVGSYGSPKSRIRARMRMGRTQLDVHDGDESSDGDDGGREKTGKAIEPRKKRHKPSAGSDSDDSYDSDASESSESSDASKGRSNNGKAKCSQLKNPYSISPTTLKATQICCPSTIDDITMMNLPKNKPHVCYVAPDGKSRHCFTLDTLYRIAISSPSANANDDVLATLNGGGRRKLAFLQPPHFRSPMDDDLLDQIASRFGRSALIIEESTVYKRMKGGSLAAALEEELDDFDEDGEYVGYAEGTGAPARRNFQDRFERYMQNLMGSTDVYCCPLCYNEADRRLGTGGDEEMWEDDETSTDGEGAGEEPEDRMAFLDDPLTILGGLDSEQFEVAASFCFRLLSGLKTHLKAVHGVKVSDVAGNDLFKRFQIRASDGLLQSWLKKSLRQNTVQGDMMRYWLNGENQSFVLLLSQIDRNRLRGEQSGEHASDFSVSFPNRAKRIWRDVSAPYLKDTQDIGDFIAEEGEDVEEEAVAVNPHFTPPDGKGRNFKSPEEEMIEHLRKKNQKHPTFDDSNSSSSAGDDGGDESSDESLEVLPEPPQYEEVEEEDEWTKSKRLKAKKSKQKKLRTNVGGDSSEDNAVFGSDNDTGEPRSPEVEANGKRVIDDGNGFHSDAERPKPDAQAKVSIRKRVFESSDEESD